jgi:enamine deaminase RidA (YjgF/YER057c/UK114 family)
VPALLDRADLPAIQRVRSRYVVEGTAPASILMQVAGLVVTELLVELVPIAVVPRHRFRRLDLESGRGTTLDQ